jgi:hypothetical protein
VPLARSKNGHHCHYYASHCPCPLPPAPEAQNFQTPKQTKKGKAGAGGGRVRRARGAPKKEGGGAKPKTKTKNKQKPPGEIKTTTTDRLPSLFFAGVFGRFSRQGEKKNMHKKTCREEQIGIYRILLSMRLYGFQAFIGFYYLYAGFYIPKAARSRIASVRSASFGPARVSAGIKHGVWLVASGFFQRLPTASNGDERGPKYRKTKKAVYCV